MGISQCKFSGGLCGIDLHSSMFVAWSVHSYGSVRAREQYAAFSNWLEVAQALLESRADPNLADDSGYTPLHVPFLSRSADTAHRMISDSW
jgi:hypothetical protein